MIITTDGFRIYKDKQKREMIRTLAKKRGIIILTDSDVAGFQIRNLIRSVVKDADVTNLYIPQIEGKEKRKRITSKEGTLGVEGMDCELLRELFRKQGVLESKEPTSRQITRADFLLDGLSGGQNSSLKREWLLKQLNLPSYLSSKALLQVLNRLMSYDEYRKLVDELPIK